jgi:hypothetical protein
VRPFFDLEAGTLHYVHADPHDIANLLRIRTDSVLRRQRWVATARVADQVRVRGMAVQQPWVIP